MTEQQLSIDGIGQQKATIANWKKENRVYTHFSAMTSSGGLPWSSWTENPDPIDELSRYGDSAFGFGNSEKEAIIDVCKKQKIKLPFWY